jgi:hypothetical protein
LELASFDSWDGDSCHFGGFFAAKIQRDSRPGDGLYLGSFDLDGRFYFKALDDHRRSGGCATPGYVLKGRGMEYWKVKKKN